MNNFQPDEIRRHIVPKHKRVVDLVHAHGKPFLLHSCGKIYDVMDEVGIDAKHSGDEAIDTFDVWAERYGDKVDRRAITYNILRVCFEPYLRVPAQRSRGHRTQGKPMKRFFLAIIAFQASLAMAGYVDFVPAGAGGIDDPANWPGSVFPSGGTTGVVTAANTSSWIGTGVLQNFALRQTGGWIDGVGAVALRGGSSGSGLVTVYEIEDSNTDYASYTNLTASGELTLWSQYGERMELSLLSGHVETPKLNLVSDGNGTINLRDGILHAGIWAGGNAKVNMLAAGTGSIVVDDMNGVGTGSLYLNFETGSRGSFTFGENQGATASGSWELAIAFGHLLVDGVVETDPSKFHIADSSPLGTTIRLFSALPGLAVVNGTLYKAGMAYRGVGINYCDLFQSMIEFPEYAGQAEYRTLEGLRFLGEQGIPFVRFWACGFWPSNWDLYFNDKEEWFSRMDLLVATAEEANVGLIPSLFWRWETYPELMNEYRDEWGNPASAVRQFMTNYVHEVVGRYKDSPAIWGWEFCNELNLGCDLPNWEAFAGTNTLGYGYNLGVEGKSTEFDPRNKMTYAIAESAFNAFSQEVRKLDTHRFITTGNSGARVYAWHNRMENGWTTDTYAQAKEAFGWMQPPASIDMASIHFYTMSDSNPSYAGATGVSNVLARYREFCSDQNQAMFVGEYSSFWDKAYDVDAQRADEEALLDAIVGSGADLAAPWTFDYTYNRTTVGIVREDNDYTWVLDLVREYDAKMRGEIPRSLTGVPVEWFDLYGITPTGTTTLAKTEIQDLNANGALVWEEYYAGTHPVDPDLAFAFTGFQIGGDFSPSLSWWGGTNGLMTPYAIQSTTNLADSAGWRTIGTKSREQGTNTWVGASSGCRSCCYRVLAVPE